MSVKDMKGDSNKKAVAWIKTWPNIKIKNGKSFAELLTYQHISLWWFAEIWFYDSLKKILEGVKSYGTYNTNNFKSLIAKYYMLSKAILRWFFGHLSYNKGNKNMYKVLAVSYTLNWRKISNPKFKKLKTDIMVGDVITELKNRNFGVIALDQDSKLFMDFKTFFEKTLYERSLWKPVEAYLTIDMIRRSFKASNSFEKLWDELKEEPNFKNTLKYENFSLFNSLRSNFEIFFRDTFQDVLYIELIKHAIAIEKPNLILIICEYCLLGRAAVIAGKFKKVPSLAVQHGNITPYSIEYYHSAEEISDEIAPQYCPIPDKTVVYSPYDKELLVNVGHYPPDSVLVTGSSRYDILNHADKIYDKNKIFEDLGLDTNKKMVLWTTQTHVLSLEENIQNISAVYNTVKSLGDIQLVIKLHPGEDQKASLYQKNKSVKPVIVGRKADTYALLYACDLMITRHSTTATEAVALNKPVVIMNLSGEPNPVEYVKEGVALGVYKEKDLTPAIEKLLKDDTDLAENRKGYIKKHLYKIDGKASERVVNLIEEMMKENE